MIISHKIHLQKLGYEFHIYQNMKWKFGKSFELQFSRVRKNHRGDRYVEGEPLTFGYLMLDDSVGFPYYRLFNVG